jgi:hypothetical protein
MGTMIEDWMISIPRGEIRLQDDRNKTSWSSKVANYPAWKNAILQTLTRIQLNWLAVLMVTGYRQMQNGNIHVEQTRGQFNTEISRILPGMREIPAELHMMSV